MTNKILIAPSLLSADFARLEDEIKKVERSGADMIHLDIMDGHFVPNITIGPVVVKAIRKCTKMILDAHLMIEAPHKFIKDFVDAGADIVTIHAEAYRKGSRFTSVPSTRLSGTSVRGKVQGSRFLEKEVSITVEKIEKDAVGKALKQIKSFGKKAGLALNPDSLFCIKEVLNEADMILFMSVHPGFGGQSFIEGVLPKIKEARKIYSGDIQVDGGINDKNAKSVVDAGANILVAGSYFFGADDPKKAVEKLKNVV